MSISGINVVNSGINPLAAMMARRNSPVVSGPKELSPVLPVPGSLSRMPAGQREAVAEQSQRALPQLVSQTAAPAVAWLGSSNPRFSRDSELKSVPFLAA